MSTKVRVSVVMSVFNGGSHLQETLDGLGCQEGDIEFIIVDDGSTDESGAILDRFAAVEPRARILHQSNEGLTRALASGCAQARGEFIARQDAGDMSRPGRFQAQADFLQARQDAVMTACAVQFLGPGREVLYCPSRPLMELDHGLRQTRLEDLKGPPHHGAAMFRRAAYEAVGGYRLPFVVAQDMDLWLRLAEKGLCLGTDDVLYQARLEAGSISSRRRGDQFRLGALALACAKARSEGRDEKPLIAAYIPGPATPKRIGAFECARFHYFIASCLRGIDPKSARHYYRLALRENPLHLKALLRLLAG